MYKGCKINNHYHFLQLADIDDLLQDPSIEVSSDLVRSLITDKRTKELQLYKKHKKIPKALKGLI